MKTRQQRLAEEGAGHPPSPPQSLLMNQRGPRRARSKTPSATVAAGSVVPAAQSAELGEPQALLRVLVEVDSELSGREVDDPTHQVAFDSSLLPEVVEFLYNNCNASNENLTLHQEIPEQEMGDAGEPKEPKPITAVKPTKRRENAFQRNSLMRIYAALKSQPVPASADTSAADSIPMVSGTTSTSRRIHQTTKYPSSPRRSHPPTKTFTWSTPAKAEARLALRRNSFTRQTRNRVISPPKLREEANGA